jgi:PTH1 family peptidyl-tRNA hydrolase
MGRKLIVALGNPGTKYEKTRHNAAWQCLQSFGMSWTSEAPFLAQMCRDHDSHVYMKPTTYMNLSGNAVKAYCDFYKISAPDVVVIHDDVDIKLGNTKIVSGGGSSHNGIRSISEMIGNDFIRVRIGVGRPAKDSGIQLIDWVLGEFSDDEISQLQPAFEFVKSYLWGLEDVV